MTEIDKKYSALGGSGGFLGAPQTAETACPDGVGRYRHYNGGSIYWHPLTGAHEVHGLIRAKWAALGWEKSFLGYPKTDETDSGGGAPGRYNLFQGGAILWKKGAKEAFETHGAIRSKFGQHGFEAGFLGFPQTDETKTPDGVGRYNTLTVGRSTGSPPSRRTRSTGSSAATGPSTAGRRTPSWATPSPTSCPPSPARRTASATSRTACCTGGAGRRTPRRWRHSPLVVPAGRPRTWSTRWPP